MGWKGKFFGAFLGGLPRAILGDIVQEGMKTGKKNNSDKECSIVNNTVKSEKRY
jgi:hypothetical protein